MYRVKKYPVTKKWMDYTVTVKECYEDDGWLYEHMYKVAIYVGRLCFPWDKVYRGSYYYSNFTPKEVVEQAFREYEQKWLKETIEKEKWQELIDWDGNLDSN